MNKITLPFSLLLCALLSTPSLAAQRLDGISAVVNEEAVLSSELSDAVESVKLQFRNAGNDAPPEDVLREKVLERLVLTKIQLQRASQVGIRITESQLNMAVNNIAERNKLSLAEFAEQLRKDGVNYLDFRNTLREELTVTQLRRQMVDSRIQVTEREIDDALATLAAQARSDTSYQLQHILIATPEAASPDVLEARRAEAEQLIKQLQDGANFAQLAQSHSDGQNALEGGDLGWRKLTEVPSLFVDALSELDAGEFTTSPIQSPSGFHLLFLAATRGTEVLKAQQVNARHILIPVADAASEAAAKTTLRTIQDRLENGDSFAALAAEYSGDPGSKDKGGDLGWQDPSIFVPEFEQAARTLPVGETTLVRSQFGYHVLQILDRREVEGGDELRRRQIQNDIANRKLQEEAQLWQRRLIDEAYIEYRL